MGSHRVGHVWSNLAAAAAAVPQPGRGGTQAPEVEVQNPNHWTIREFPHLFNILHLRSSNGEMYTAQLCGPWQAEEEGPVEAPQLSLPPQPKEIILPLQRASLHPSESHSVHPDSSDHSGYSRLGFTISPQFEHSKDRHNLPWPLLDCISCCTRPLWNFSVVPFFFFFALPRTRWSWMGVDRGRVVRIEVWSWLGNLPSLLLHFIGTEYLTAAGGEDGSGPPIPRPSSGCCYKATLVYLATPLPGMFQGWLTLRGRHYLCRKSCRNVIEQGRNGQLLGAKKLWARKSPIKAPRCLEPNCLNNKRVLGCCAGDGTLGRRLTSWIGVVLYGVYRTLGLGFYSFVSL